MTREMNKPDWHNNWIYRERTDNGTFIKEFYKKNTLEEIRKLQKVDCRIELSGEWVKPKERVLNPLIAEFFYQTNERLKK